MIFNIQKEGANTWRGNDGVEGTAYVPRILYENDINFQKISLRMMKIIINMSVWNLYVIFNIKIF